MNEYLLKILENLLINKKYIKNLKKRLFFFSLPVGNTVSSALTKRWVSVKGEIYINVPYFPKSRKLCWVIAQTIC